jgi:hypothetical protein
MASLDARAIVVEARRRPYDWLQLYVCADDAPALYRAVTGLLASVATPDAERPGLVAVACQLRQALRRQ